jgi:hypothetical protein
MSIPKVARRGRSRPRATEAEEDPHRPPPTVLDAPPRSRPRRRRPASVAVGSLLFFLLGGGGGGGGGGVGWAPTTTGLARGRSLRADLTARVKEDPRRPPPHSTPHRLPLALSLPARCCRRRERRRRPPLSRSSPPLQPRALASPLLPSLTKTIALWPAEQGALVVAPQPKRAKNTPRSHRWSPLSLPLGRLSPLSRPIRPLLATRPHQRQADRHLCRSGHAAGQDGVPMRSL